jgi:hypothetical protein
MDKRRRIMMMIKIRETVSPQLINYDTEEDSYGSICAVDNVI